MNLAQEILNFFNDAWLDGNTLRPYSLMNFVKKFDQQISRVYEITRYCKKLEQEGLLDHQGRTGDHPYFGHHYYTNKSLFANDLNLYGSYDLLVNGFLSVRERFKDICLPLSVVLTTGDYSIGSSFIYNANTIITARHCIDGPKKVSVLDSKKNIIPIVNVYFPTDENLDLAVLETPKNYFDQFAEFKLEPKPDHIGETPTDALNFIDEPTIAFLGEGTVLDDILTLGYPPIAGFEDILIADKSSINSILLRSSIGQVLTEEKKYGDDIEYFLINAKVKGGNSGGPVFDRFGRVIGIVVEIPRDFQNYELVDKLGYGIVIPSKYIKQLLTSIRHGGELCQNKAITIFDDNSFALV